MNTRFAHIRNASRPYTIAFTELPYGTSGTVAYSIAECSAKDNFCKRIGREVAEGRLAKGIFSTIHSDSSRFSDIVRKITESVEGE